MFKHQKSLDLREPDSSKKDYVRSAKELREAEFGWKNTETLNSVPPSDYTITHVNQNHDLLRLDDHKVSPLMNLSTSEWLKNYGVEKMQLTLKDLLAKGVVSKYVSF